MNRLVLKKSLISAILFFFIGLIALSVSVGIVDVLRIQANGEQQGYASFDNELYSKRTSERPFVCYSGGLTDQKSASFCSHSEFLDFALLYGSAQSLFFAFSYLMYSWAIFPLLVCATYEYHFRKHRALPSQPAESDVS
ncbi:MAG: hypothetical protein HOE53_00330 [Candidatus Magasanikbacteria bacterium]|jgi:hypothetical protein|nr:hypothetical protein [Candidatus Magasanikbacteria bacterium]